MKMRGIQAIIKSINLKGMLWSDVRIKNQQLLTGNFSM